MKSTRHPLVPEFDRDWLCLLESMHSLDFRMGWTRHPFLKIITALRGSGVFETKTGKRLYSHSLSPGNVIVIFPDTLHRLLDEPGEPLLIYILCIGSAFPVKIPTTRELRLINDPATAGRALRGLREIASLSKKTGNSGKIDLSARELLRSGLVATLLGRLFSASNRREKNLLPPDSKSRVRGLISRLPDEFFVSRSIDDAAAELRLSRRRFTQLFSEVAGETYAVRIRSLRLAHACRLLRGKELSPVTVAFECGYGELSTFYRDFRDQMGISPAAWGRRHRHKDSG